MQEQEKNLSLLQMIGSLLASFFGVQSSENRERDFTRGRARDFILVGIFMTAVLVCTIYATVTFMLGNA